MGPLAWTPADFFLKALVVALTRSLASWQPFLAQFTASDDVIFHPGETKGDPRKRLMKKQARRTSCRG